MAKKSKIARNEQRRVVVARYAGRRAELKQITPPRTSAPPPSGNCGASPATRAPPRLRNRDAIDGRPRGYVGAFGLSRLNLRRMAHAGELPGVRKSSW